jgi:3-oxoacyl-[acyl-carrier protein] reductase
MMCDGRVALVTGAAGDGMGRSIALTLAREGAKVVVNYRTSEDRAHALVDNIASRGGTAVAVGADVFTLEGCTKLVDATVDRFGSIDILVIGPGAGWHPEPPSQLDAHGALEDARSELAPIYYLMPRILPSMYEQGWGRVVAVALEPPFSSPAYAYNVAKAARVHAISLACDEAWQNGVTLNTIGPGPVSGLETLDEAVEQCAHGPAWCNRATASPQDIAESVAFLCSEAGRFISGSTMPFLHIDS